MIKRVKGFVERSNSREGGEKRRGGMEREIICMIPSASRKRDRGYGKGYRKGRCHVCDSAYLPPLPYKANAMAEGVKSFLSGGFGGMCLVAVGHPLDLIKVRS
jgi:hypothetical protein